jgi:enoyl-CoA hydratase
MAKQLIYTGKVIRADEALRIGLVNEVVPQAELMNRAFELANQIAANAPLAVKAAKHCINAEYDMDADEAILYESGIFGHCFVTRDQKEGMKAFLEKRKPDFIGE